MADIGVTARDRDLAGAGKIEMAEAADVVRQRAGAGRAHQMSCPRPSYTGFRRRVIMLRTSMLVQPAPAACTTARHFGISALM